MARKPWKFSDAIEGRQVYILSVTFSFLAKRYRHITKFYNQEPGTSSSNQKETNTQGEQAEEGETWKDKKGIKKGQREKRCGGTQGGVGSNQLGPKSEMGHASMTMIKRLLPKPPIRLSPRRQ
jgi:hypothetical protein